MDNKSNQDKFCDLNSKQTELEKALVKEVQTSINVFQNDPNEETFNTMMTLTKKLIDNFNQLI